MTSARRRERRELGSGWLIGVAVLVIVTAAVVGSHRIRSGANDTTPSPPAATEVAATPTRTRTATATPALELAYTTIVVTPPPTATATATPALLPLPPTRTPWQPTPTPLASRCVVVRYTTDQVMAPQPHVLVQIDAFNRCGRVLEAGELRFRITGFRDGAPVQTAYGQAFDPAYRGGSVQAAIGLPGSADWYDRIEVRVLDRK